MITQRRAKRITRRIARLRVRQEAFRLVDELGLRAPLRAWIEEIAERHDLDLDRDNDGDIDFEDLVEAAIEVADDLISLGNPLAEFVTDVGLEAVGRIAVTIYAGREVRLARRIARLERRLRRLSPVPETTPSSS
ncbi:MAG: hypothetical protein JKY37_05715 [Nannocystaceae bacterium]|nr:hypothetical protein [Nannocystaceae bacterium]